MTPFAVVVRPRSLLVAACAALACGDRPDRQYEPPVLADRIFSAGVDSVEAFAYLTKEDRFRPGPARLSRRFDRYTLYVRRLPDGDIVRELPMGDMLDAMKDSTPRVLGRIGDVLWIQRDSVVGYRVPSLEPIPLSANAANDDSATAELRAKIVVLTQLPLWERPGSSRLFTQVSSGLEPISHDSLPTTLAEAGVLMRADRSAWQVDSPPSVLVMSIEPDSTWSVSRISRTGERRWTTPLQLRFETAFMLLDAPTHVLYKDVQSYAERSGHRDRVVWVNVFTGEARVLEIADGTVSVVSQR